MSIKVSVSRLAEQWNPFRNAIWRGSDRPLFFDDVQVALINNRLIDVPVDPSASIDDHAGRVAFLAKNGWTDPIGIDVGVPRLGCYVAWPIVDGNHRLAAAIYRKDIHILADVSGCVEAAYDLLGVSIKDDEENA